MISTRFKVIDDVPPELTEFYSETQIQVGEEVIQKDCIDPLTGESHKATVIQPIYETVVQKHPAYYDDGGHISPETVAAWNYHDAFIAYLKLCDEIELYNSTPKFNEDGEPIEFEPLPLPPKPERDSF